MDSFLLKLRDCEIHRSLESHISFVAQLYVSLDINAPPIRYQLSAKAAGSNTLHCNFSPCIRHIVIKMNGFYVSSGFALLKHIDIFHGHFIASLCLSSHAVGQIKMPQ